MPSQEEYLDNLLKDLGNMEEETQQGVLKEPEENTAVKTALTPEDEADILADMEGLEAVESDLHLQDDFADLDMSDMEELLAAAKESVMESAADEAEALEDEATDIKKYEIAELEIGKPAITEPEIAAPEIDDLEIKEPEIEVPEIKEPEGETSEAEAAVGVDDIAQMTQEDIEQLLEAGRSADTEAAFTQEEEALQTEADGEDIADIDELMRMLGSTEDEQLQDIHTMLQKADNNEAVDNDILSVLESAHHEENPAPDLGSGDSMGALEDNIEK